MKKTATTLTIMLFVFELLAQARSAPSGISFLQFKGTKIEHSTPYSMYFVWDRGMYCTSTIFGIEKKIKVVALLYPRNYNIYIRPDNTPILNAQDVMVLGAVHHSDSTYLKPQIFSMDVLEFEQPQNLVGKYPNTWVPYTLATVSNSYPDFPKVINLDQYYQFDVSSYGIKYKIKKDEVCVYGAHTWLIPGNIPYQADPKWATFQGYEYFATNSYITGYRDGCGTPYGPPRYDIDYFLVDKEHSKSEACETTTIMLPCETNGEFSNFRFRNSTNHTLCNVQTGMIAPGKASSGFGTIQSTLETCYRISGKGKWCYPPIQFFVDGEAYYSLPLDCSGETTYGPGLYTIDIRGFFPEDGRIFYKVIDDRTGKVIIEVSP